MDSTSVSTDSYAAEELRAFRARRRLSQKRFAALARIGDPAAVSRYETGLRRPDLVTASRIERVTGIPASSWIDEAELPQDLSQTAPPAGATGLEVDERKAGAA
jgi:transcriptional regulator with XRE-family HTH domain